MTDSVKLTMARNAAAKLPAAELAHRLREIVAHPRQYSAETRVALTLEAADRLAALAAFEGAK